MPGKIAQKYQVQCVQRDTTEGSSVPTCNSLKTEYIAISMFKIIFQLYFQIILKNNSIFIQYIRVTVLPKLMQS